MKPYVPKLSARLRIVGVVAEWRRTGEATRLLRTRLLWAKGEFIDSAAKHAVGRETAIVAWFDAIKELGDEHAELRDPGLRQMGL